MKHHNFSVQHFSSIAALYLLLPQAHFRRVVMYSLLILVDLHPDILHMARVKPLSEKACQTGWGDSFNMKLLLCTDAAASTSCLVQ